MLKRLLLFLIAASSGGLFMAFELICAIQIQPDFGSSFQIWTIVLSVSVFSLAFGYYISTRIPATIKIPILFTAILLSAVYINYTPIIYSYSLHITENSSLTIQAFLSVTIILLLPGILLGLVTPLIISFDLYSDTGKNSGRLYSFSTLSSLIYTLVTGLILIPQFSFTSCLQIISFPVIILTGLYLFIYNSPKSSIVVIIAVIVVFFKSDAQDKNTSKIIYSAKGVNGQISVIDIHNDETNSRLMLVNGMGQTWINKADHSSVWSYVNFITVAAGLVKEKPDVLIIGLGGGILANKIHEFTGANIDAVEFDERIAECAKKYFALNSNTKVFIDDGRHFLNTCKKQYDLIVFDVFSGDVAPSHLLSLECFELTKEKLKENGVVAVNFNGFEKIPEGYGSRVLYKTMVEAGYSVHIVPTYEKEELRNTIFIASTTNIDISRSRLMVNFNFQKYPLSSFEVHPQRWFTLKPEITDDRPLMEHYNFKAAESWRKDFKKLLLKNNINI